MNLSQFNREVWLWLLQRGGYWTAEEMARTTGHDSQQLFRALHGMSRRQLVAQVAPAPGSRKKRYGVTGTCLVPLGLCVAEVQAL